MCVSASECVRIFYVCSCLYVCMCVCTRKLICTCQFSHSYLLQLTWLIAGLLPCAYIVGLLFTLKTHTDIYNPPVKAPGGAHGHAGKLQFHTAPQVVCVHLISLARFITKGVA